jgi:DNA-directed RNA polymerase subunit alpha
VDSLDDVPIEELDLSVRTYNCLKRSGITSVDQLMALTYPALMGIRNFSRVSYEHLREQLISHHFMTREEPRGPFAQEQ